MIPATVRNMRKYYLRASLDSSQHPFAYSPVTGERYSATPGDYFWMPDDETLIDEDGAPMVLAVENCEVRPL